MKGRIFVLGILLFAAQTCAQEPRAPGDRVSVVVLKGNEVVVHIPGLSKEQMSGILAIFLADHKYEGDKEAEDKLKTVLGRASNLSLVITTRHGLK